MLTLALLPHSRRTRRRSHTGQRLSDVKGYVAQTQSLQMSVLQSVTTREIRNRTLQYALTKSHPLRPRGIVA